MVMLMISMYFQKKQLFLIKFPINIKKYEKTIYWNDNRLNFNLFKRKKHKVIFSKKIVKNKTKFLVTSKNGQLARTIISILKINCYQKL